MVNGNKQKQFLGTILATYSTFSCRRLKGFLAQTLPLKFMLHHVQPVDFMLIKTWKEDKFQAHWEGLYQALLTTVKRTTKGGLTTLELKDWKKKLWDKKKGTNGKHVNHLKHL